MAQGFRMEKGWIRSLHLTCIGRLLKPHSEYFLPAYSKQPEAFNHLIQVWPSSELWIQPHTTGRYLSDGPANCTTSWPAAGCQIKATRIGEVASDKPAVLRAEQQRANAVQMCLQRWARKAGAREGVIVTGRGFSCKFSMLLWKSTRLKCA